VYILIACSFKNLCGIAQLDVGYVTICSVERTIRVLWHSVARNGWSGTLQPDTFNLERRLVHIESLDDQCLDAYTSIEENKICFKVQYDKYVCPRLYG
jgi:hypothetical protein